MNYTRQIDFTDLRETLNKIDNVDQTIMEREVSITTLNRWAKYAKDVADYMSNQLSKGDTIPTTMDSFLKNSGFSDEKKQAIKDDPYYFGNIKKVAQAVNTNTISTLGNTGPKTEMGTSFGGGGDATVTGRERQIKLDPALKDIQSLAKEKENATDEKSYYMPKPPEDLQFVLHGAEADPIELTGPASDDVEPTWDGQTADEIRAELDQAYGGRENWIGKKEWEDEEITSKFDATGKDIKTKTSTEPATDPAGQVITDPEDDTPLEQPMDWDMDDIDTQFKDLDKEYDADQKAKADAKAKAERDALRKEVQAEIDLEKDIDFEGSRQNWQNHFDTMSQDEFDKVNHNKLFKKYGDNAIDGYLDSKFDRRDNASINAVDKEIKDLNKAMGVDTNTDATTSSTVEPTVKVEPKAEVNYGAMSDEEYEEVYDKKMGDIVSKGYNPDAKDWDEKAFDDDMWKQLNKLDALRAQQKKDIVQDKQLDKEMKKADDQFTKLDKEIAHREKKANFMKDANKNQQLQMPGETTADFLKRTQEIDAKNIEKHNKQAAADAEVKRAMQKAGRGHKIKDVFKKPVVKKTTPTSSKPETDISKAIDTVADAIPDSVKDTASDAYDATKDYFTSGQAGKDFDSAVDYVSKEKYKDDASRLKKYIQSPQARKDAKAKGKEHRAYLDKKADEVGDYFAGGEFGKDVDDASDWIGKQWNSLFGDDKKK